MPDDFEFKRPLPPMPKLVRNRKKETPPPSSVGRGRGRGIQPQVNLETPKNLREKIEGLQQHISSIRDLLEDDPKQKGLSDDNNPGGGISPPLSPPLISKLKVNIPALKEYFRALIKHVKEAANLLQNELEDSSSSSSTASGEGSPLSSPRADESGGLKPINLMAPLSKETNNKPAISTKREDSYYKSRNERHNRLCKFIKIPVGLTNNDGTTCWYNVVVQMLYHIPIFRQMVLEMALPEDGHPEPWAVVDTLKDLFIDIGQSNRKCRDSSFGKDAVIDWFGPGQQDANECLSLILDCVERLGLAAARQLFVGSYFSQSKADPEPFLQYVVRVEDAGRLWPLLKASLRTNDRKWATLPSILLVGLCRINTDNYCTKLNHRLEFNAFMFDVQAMASQERESSLSWPYQLLAVVVHLGRSNAGHFMLIVWQAEQQVWQFIDDEKTGFLEWAKVVEFAFGGPQSRIDGSAHCLVYIDARQAADLLNTENEYRMVFGDVLSYLRDANDVRVSNEAYGFQSTLSVVESLPANSPCQLLYAALEKAREELARQSFTTDAVSSVCNRVKHFGIYLMANGAALNPFVLWALLIHFASYKMLLQPQTIEVCKAARHSLAFLEKSTTDLEKRLFLDWNRCYNRFHQIVRYLISAVTHVNDGNYSAATYIAISALYIHHDLIKDTLVTSPALSVDPNLLYNVVCRSLESLSAELLQLVVSGSQAPEADETCVGLFFDAALMWIHWSVLVFNTLAVVHCTRLAAQWRNVAVLERRPAALTESVLEKLYRLEDLCKRRMRGDLGVGQRQRIDFKKCVPWSTPADGEAVAQLWTATVNANTFLSSVVTIMRQPRPSKPL